jgi:hypothetical protein
MSDKKGHIQECPGAGSSTKSAYNMKIPEINEIEIPVQGREPRKLGSNLNLTF